MSKKIVLFSDPEARELCGSDFENDLTLNQGKVADGAENALALCNDDDEIIIVYPDGAEVAPEAQQIARQIAKISGRMRYDERTGRDEFLHLAMWFVPMALDDPFQDFGHLADMAKHSAEPARFERAAVWPEFRFLARTASEIAEEKATIEPVIGGLLGRGESLIIAGAGGVGKSALLNMLGLALGCRDDLWGLFPIPKKFVTLLIQPENSFAAQSSRLNLLLSARPDLREGGRKFYTLTDQDRGCRIAGDFGDPGFYSNIRQASTAIGADLWFIDPLISFNPGSENDNTQMRRILDALQSAADAAAVSLVITHHFGRENKWRGASAIRDWTANMLLLELEKIENGEALIKVIHDKSRNFIQQDPFFLKRTRDLDFVRIDPPGSKEDAWSRAAVTALHGLAGVVDQQGPLLAAIQQALNCGSTTAKKAVAAACARGMMMVIPAPDGGKRCGYRLPDAKPVTMVTK
jgi:hypothetical protein